MRLDPNLVHPSIFKATDGVLWSGQMASPSTGNMRAVADHQRIWFREYGKCLLLYLVAAVAVPVVVSHFADGLDKTLRIFLVLATVLAMIALGLAAYARNLRQISAPELGALLPLLDLTEGQRTYAETVVALDRSGRPMAEIEETMIALNALLDEEARLVEARGRLAGTDLDAGRDGLASERARLVDRLERARDPEARLALEGSLGLLDERIAAVDAQGGGLERIDAHLELLRQALLATRDAALHRSAAPALPDSGTDALRAAVARARAEAQATERALAELDAR